MRVTEKIIEDAIRGTPAAGAQRRNVVGQFHGPRTAVPVIEQPDVPDLDCLESIDEDGGLLGRLDTPASASDGCEDGMGDF